MLNVARAATAYLRALILKYNFSVHRLHYRAERAQQLAGEHDASHLSTDCFIKSFLNRAASIRNHFFSLAQQSFEKKKTLLSHVSRVGRGARALFQSGAWRQTRRTTVLGCLPGKPPSPATI